MTDMHNTRIECSQVILRIDGTDYSLYDVNSMTFTSGKTKRLIRGLGGKNKKGVLVNENLDTANTYEIETHSLSESQYQVLKKMWEDNRDKRFELFYYDEEKQKSVELAECGLCSNPHQTDYASDTFMKTTLNIQTYDEE